MSLLKKPKPAAGERWLADVSVCIGDAGLSSTDKLNLKRIITAHGGTVSYLVHPKTTHLVTSEEEVRVCSQKVRTAGRYGVRLVSPAWLLDSAAAGQRQDEALFTLVPLPDRNNNAALLSTTPSSSSSFSTAATSLSADSDGSFSAPSAAHLGSTSGAGSSAGSVTLGSAALVNRPRGTWLTPTAAAVSTSSSSSSPSASSTPYADLFDEDVLLAVEHRLIRNLRLAGEVTRLLLPPSSPFVRAVEASSSSSLSSSSSSSSSSSLLARLLRPPVAGCDGRGPNGEEADEKDRRVNKKEKWALALAEKHQQRRAAEERRQADKSAHDRGRAQAQRRAKNAGDRELEQSFKVDAQSLKRQRLEELRHQRLAKLREGWLAELARRKQRDEIRAEEKRKRREAWEEKQREKERRRQDYELKKREWESKQAERALKQAEWDAQIAKWEVQKRAELYKKFFLGNLHWKDITVEEMGSENAVEFARQKRFERLRVVLESFGPVTCIKEHWEHSYVFVVYNEREHAEKAMAAMSSHEERVKITKAIRKQLLEEGQPLIYTPTPDFYARWPKKEPHPDPAEELRKAEAELQQKLKEEKRREEEAQEIADGWEKKKPAPKKNKKQPDAAASSSDEAKPAEPDVRPPKVKRGVDGKSKKKREKRKKKEAEKREQEDSKKGKKGKKAASSRPPAPPANNSQAGAQSAVVEAKPARGGGARGGARGGRGRGGPARGGGARGGACGGRGRGGPALRGGRGMRGRGRGG